MMTTAAQVHALSRAELQTLLERGHPIDPDALAGHEYRGTSLGLPAWVDRVAWRHFVKAFYRDRPDARVRGWNLRVAQDGSFRPLERHGRPASFGHFAVVADPRGPGLLLDYGAGGNRRLDPVSRLRDPLVAVDAGSVELLLGRSLIALAAGLSLGTPSYFTLERAGRVVTAPAPPAAPRHPAARPTP